MAHMRRKVKRKGKRGQDGEESFCFRLGRRGRRGKDGEERTARKGRKIKLGKDSEEKTDFHIRS